MVIWGNWPPLVTLKGHGEPELNFILVISSKYLLLMSPNPNLLSFRIPLVHAPIPSAPCPPSDTVPTDP